MTPAAGNKADKRTPKTIRLDDTQWELIRGLTPFYGATELEVIRNIVVMWLHENISGKSIEKLSQLGAIRLKDEY
jgi:hypothetical protein